MCENKERDKKKISRIDKTKGREYYGKPGKLSLGEYNYKCQHIQSLINIIGEI